MQISGKIKKQMRKKHRSRYKYKHQTINYGIILGINTQHSTPYIDNKIQICSANLERMYNVYVYTSIHVYVHTCIHEYVRALDYTCIRYVLMCLHVHVLVNSHILRLFFFAYSHITFTGVF